MEISQVCTDQELLEKIKANDKEAFEALYYRYFEQLSRFAFRRLQDEDVTEELVQDVFVEIWKKRHTLDLNGNVAALMHAIIRNKALHELRARMIKSKHHDNYTKLHLHNSTSENEEGLYAKEAEDKMKKAIDGLSPQCREAFTLSRYENLSYKEIAGRMNISVNTVEKHIGKALSILRSEFKDYHLSSVLMIGLLELALSR